MAQNGATRAGGSKLVLRAALFLALALLAAGAAALLLTRWVNAREAVVRIPTVRVVVSAADLPVGTRLAREQLRAIDWPAASRPESAAADPADLDGEIVAARIFKGEAVLREKLVSGRAGGGLAALLPAGSRAVSVRVDDVVGVAGFIHPGDLVDVIVTMRAGEGNTPFTSKIILQGIKVLAVGHEVDAQARRGDRAPAATVATLQVDSDQAERLALAAAKGQLLLALRSAADGDIVATSGVAPRALLAEGEPQAERQVQAPPRRPARVAAAKPKETPKADKQVIEILRGDLYERRGFDRKEGSP